MLYSHVLSYEYLKNWGKNNGQEVEKQTIASISKAYNTLPDHAEVAVSLLADELMLLLLSCLTSASRSKNIKQ